MHRVPHFHDRNVNVRAMRKYKARLMSEYIERNNKKGYDITNEGEIQYSTI